MGTCSGVSPHTADDIAALLIITSTGASIDLVPPIDGDAGVTILPEIIRATMRSMRTTLVGLLVTVGISVPCFGTGATGKSLTRQPPSWRFCPSDRDLVGPMRTLENAEGRSLHELLNLATKTIIIEARSSDWKSDGQALRRIREVLRSHPRTLTSMPLWAEGEWFRSKYVAARLGPVTIEAADYHVCLKDKDGRFWYFRTVAADGWKK